MGHKTFIIPLWAFFILSVGSTSCDGQHTVAATHLQVFLMPSKSLTESRGVCACFTFPGGEDLEFYINYDYFFGL